MIRIIASSLINVRTSIVSVRTLEPVPLRRTGCRAMREHLAAAQCSSSPTAEKKHFCTVCVAATHGSSISFDEPIGSDGCLSHNDLNHPHLKDTPRNVQSSIVRILGRMDSVTNPLVPEYLIQGKTGLWKMAIGLEIHAQITAKTKLFSAAPASFGDLPNHNVSIFDASVPGTLPTLNEECINQAIRTGIAIHGKINNKSHFDRKHYFYCDLPSGYQITQRDCPIVTGGYLDLTLPDHTTKRVSIERIQLETDSGKSLHDQDDDLTLVDLNRAGCALMEIVGCPEANSPVEASIFIKKLQLILKYLDVCNGNMEEGSLRCDANVSVQRADSEKKGTRCEIKNLNSIRSLARAIEYEAHRQVTLIEGGQVVEQQTRFYNPLKRVTLTGREKQNLADYLFLPECDLLPVIIEQKRIDRLVQGMPLLPDEVRSRLLTDYKLDSYDASTLANHVGAAAYFERVAEKRREHVKEIANWITNDLFSQLKENRIDIENCPISSAQLGELMDLISSGEVSSRIAKDVISAIFRGDQRGPRTIVEEQGMTQIKDLESLQHLCQEIILSSPKEVKDYQSGNERVMKYFVGQIMKRTSGKAPGQAVTNIFHRLIFEIS